MPSASIAPARTWSGPLALLALVVGDSLRLSHPASAAVELACGYPLGDGAQFVLVVGIGDAGQCADFAVGQSAVGEAAGDLVDRRQGVADAQPLADRAHLGIGALRDPMRAAAGVVEGPLAREVELDQQRR